MNIVEDCDISYTDLTSEQVEHIFEVMMSNTRLKKLNIRGNCLRQVIQYFSDLIINLSRTWLIVHASGQSLHQLYQKQ